jgi:hypothetical protein
MCATRRYAAMAFAPNVIRDVARTRGVRARRDAGRPRFVRHSALGTEAVYEIVDEGRELVTAAVVQAPGLAPGTRVRFLARAARAMDEISAEQAGAFGRASRAAADTPPRAA